MQSINVIFDRCLEAKISDISTHISPERNAKITPPPVFGLLIGQRSGSSIYVLHIARTIKSNDSAENLNNATESPSDVKSKKSRTTSGGKKSTPLNEPQLDADHILHHVHQAIRMLPGGLDVVGVFMAADSKATTPLLPVVNKALRSSLKYLLKVAGMSGAVPLDPKTVDCRMLLLTLEPLGGKKPTVVVVDCGPDTQISAPSTNVPFTYQNTRWKAFATRLLFDAPLVVPSSKSNETFFKQFLDAIGPWCRRVFNAKAAFNGDFRDMDEQFPNTKTETSTSGTKKKGKKNARNEEEDENTDDAYERVEFYFVDDEKINDNIGKMDFSENTKGRNVSAVMHMRGSLYCVAYAHQKSTFGEAVRALKTDALRSLYARCQLHYEGMTVLEGEELDPVAVHQFPRRVLLPFSTSASTVLTFTDYLFEGDEAADAVVSFKDILDVDADVLDVDDALESVPDEQELENLLRSSSLGGTPEGSVGEGETERNLIISDNKKGSRFLQTTGIIYVLVAVLVALLAYVLYAFVSK